MMIFSSLPPVIEIITVGAVAVAFVTVVLLVFYCTPTWRKKGELEETKFGGMECEHEHQWTKASHEQGTSTQRIAYYGTLSLSAQNSPTKHLRSISATNPPTHFLSPSHSRSPRRNSSPIAQNQVQLGCSRALSPHVLDLNSYTVQPPYWDPESQQYFHCYSHDSTHASPLRKKSPSRATAGVGVGGSSTSTTASPAKRSTPPNPYYAQQQQQSGMSSNTMSLAGGLITTKKVTDYSNLFLPPAPMKNTLLTSFNSSTTTTLPKEAEDILQVSTDKEENFKVTLQMQKEIPTICSTPPEEEEGNDGDESETILLKSSHLQNQNQNQIQNQNQHPPEPEADILRSKREMILNLAEGEEKHASEVN